MRGVTKRQERDSSKPRTLRLPCFCASGGQRHVPGPCPRGVMSPEPPSARGWGSSQTCIAEGQALHPPPPGRLRRPWGLGDAALRTQTERILRAPCPGAEHTELEVFSWNSPVTFWACTFLLWMGVGNELAFSVCGDVLRSPASSWVNVGSFCLRNGSVSSKLARVCS